VQWIFGSEPWRCRGPFPVLSAPWPWLALGAMALATGRTAGQLLRKEPSASKELEQRLQQVEQQRLASPGTQQSELDPSRQTSSRVVKSLTLCRIVADVPTIALPHLGRNGNQSDPALHHGYQAPGLR